ncbi:MAG: extracellular solute-binding protein [Spirochaetales bacterium]|nr:extracellular solute-binding protein [Spirochaetales bacterium]
MKSLIARSFFVLLFALMAASVCFAGAQGEAEKEVVNLTYWSVCNFPGYDPFWEEIAKRLNAERPEVDLTLTLTCIPYQGYEAKYRSAFEAGKGPDIFFDMTHVTAGELEVSEKMPDDIAKKLEGLMGGPGSIIGIYDGVRYGVPVEGGYFMMMFINADMYREVGLDPNRGAATYMEMLDHAKKLTKYDASGKITRSGYAIRYAGHAFGIADKALPFVDAWGTKVLDWDEKKASGYVNSPEAVEAVDFYGGLVTREKVSSVELGVPMDIFAQGIGGIMFRECFAAAWIKKNNPDLDYRVYALPKHKVASGYAGNFPWSLQVNKDAPERNRKWAWEVMRYFVDHRELRKELAVNASIIPPFTDLLSEPEFTSHPAFDAFMTMAAGRAATNYHIPPAQEVLQVFGQAVLDVMFGNDRAKPALDKAAVTIDEILARY